MSTTPSVEERALEAIRANGGAHVLPRAVENAFLNIRRGCRVDLACTGVWRHSTPSERYAVDQWLNAWDNPLADAMDQTDFWRFEKLVDAIIAAGR
jgi:hypothetical protein